MEISLISDLLILKLFEINFVTVGSENKSIFLRYLKM